MFNIDKDMNISFGEAESEGALNFSSQKAFQALADSREWSREDLEGIWNSFAGVVPFDNLKPVKKFRNRPYGVAQIWKAIQRLAKGEPQEAEPEKPAKVAKAQKQPKVKAPKVAKVKTESHRGEKREAVIALLNRDKGVSIEELMEKMGWQRHTVRGFMSTLGSKHGVKIESTIDEKRGLVYRAA